MKVVKTIRSIAGMAVGGGILLVLSGSAFAADGGEGTISQNNLSTVAKSIEGASASEATKKTDAVNVVVTGEARGGGKDIGGGTQPSSSASQVPIVGAKSAQSNNVDAKTGSVANTVSASTEKVGGVVPGVDESGISRQTDAEKATLVGGAMPLENIAVKPTIIGGLTQVTEIGRVVVYNSERLAIQPRITNSYTQANDLASLIPSAPAQQQNPSNPTVPTAPSGLFEDFAAKLAGSVVPSVFSSPYLGLAGFAMLVIVLTMILGSGILLDVTAVGSWTRRGGYAHAARSDVPFAAAVITFFATPFRLGYVPAFAPIHSPFLVVSETKTVRLMALNANRKEEMR